MTKSTSSLIISFIAFTLLVIAFIISLDEKNIQDEVYKAWCVILLILSLILSIAGIIMARRGIKESCKNKRTIAIILNLFVFALSAGVLAALIWFSQGSHNMDASLMNGCTNCDTFENQP